MPTRSSAASARRRSARSSRSERRRPASAAQKPARAWQSAPAITFSLTVSPGNSPTFCRVRAIPSDASLCALIPVRSVPPKVSWPASGRTNPHSTLSRVVLPAPFGPMTPVTWQGAAANDTESSAVSPPKWTVTSRMSSTPGLSPGGLGAHSELVFIALFLLRRQLLLDDESQFKARLERQTRPNQIRIRTETVLTRGSDPPEPPDGQKVPVTPSLGPWPLVWGAVSASLCPRSVMIMGLWLGPPDLHDHAEGAVRGRAGAWVSSPARASRWRWAAGRECPRRACLPGR